jgi:hypothetical protein
MWPAKHETVLPEPGFGTQGHQEWGWRALKAAAMRLSHFGLKMGQFKYDPVGKSGPLGDSLPSENPDWIRRPSCAAYPLWTRPLVGAQL